MIDDSVSLSESSRQLISEFESKAASSYLAVPADQRPTAQQSADTILGFIAQQLDRRAAEGASREELENILEQGLKGFMRGFAEAFKAIDRLGLMTDDVRQSIVDTKVLVLEGFEALREQYLAIEGTDSADSADSVDSVDQGTPQINIEPVSNVTRVDTTITASRSETIEQSTTTSAAAVAGQGSTLNSSSVRAAVASYSDSYKRNESVELIVNTLDGDTVTLSFSSNFASSNSIAAFLGNAPGAALGGQSIQSSLSANINFSFAVNGDLDEGEQESLNNLLAKVSELADEFFNGDFDAALSLASEFELDTDEFSAVSLDIARSTQASVVQSYAVAENALLTPAPTQNAILSGTGLESIAKVLEQLQDALEQARSFNEPTTLLADLLANQVAQKSLNSQGFNAESIAGLLEGLLGRLS